MRTSTAWVFISLALLGSVTLAAQGRSPWAGILLVAAVVVALTMPWRSRTQTSSPATRGGKP